MGVRFGNFRRICTLWTLDRPAKVQFLCHLSHAVNESNIRVELQHAFFPPTFHDHEVTHHLKPGDKRVWTALKIFVELRDEASLHIPFREPSKVLSRFPDRISLIL